MNTRLKLILLVLVVAAAGVLLAWFVYPRPEVELQKAWKNFVHVRSLHVEASFATDSASGTFSADVMTGVPASATSTFEIAAAGKRTHGSWAFKDGLHYLLEAGFWRKSERSPFEGIVPLLDGSAGLREVFVDTEPFVLVGAPASGTDGGVAVRTYHVRLTQDAVTRLQVDDAQGDVVVGRTDHRIHAISLHFKDGASVALRFSKEGEDMRFEAPADAEDLDAKSATGSLPSSGTRGSSTSAAASATSTASGGSVPDVTASDDDGDSLENTQEFFYGSDAWNPDTDADGYGDGDEVAHGMNPVGPGGLFSFGLGG